MRLTIRHHYDFGADRSLVGRDLVRPEAWDRLRTETTGPFALPPTREAWEADAETRDDLRRRAKAIDALLREHNARSVASYGVGTGALELWLHRLDPERRLACTDYAPAVVERLAALFPEAKVHRHDLFADDPLPADVQLLHRVDTEFTDVQWRALLQRMASARLLIVATELLDWQTLMNELRTRILRPRASRAGWIRTRDAFEALWRNTHTSAPVQVADLHGWWLEPRPSASLA